MWMIMLGQIANVPRSLYTAPSRTNIIWYVPNSILVPMHRPVNLCKFIDLNFFYIDYTIRNVEIQERKIYNVEKECVPFDREVRSCFLLDEAFHSCRGTSRVFRKHVEIIYIYIYMTYHVYECAQACCKCFTPNCHYLSVLTMCDTLKTALRKE